MKLCLKCHERPMSGTGNSAKYCEPCRREVLAAHWRKLKAAKRRAAGIPERGVARPCARCPRMARALYCKRCKRDVAAEKAARKRERQASLRKAVRDGLNDYPAHIIEAKYQRAKVEKKYQAALARMGRAA